MNDPVQPTTLPAAMRLSERPMSSGEPDDPNVMRIAAYLDALARGDLGTARGLLASTVVLRIAGRSVLAGTYRGPDAVLAAEARLATLVDSATWVPAIWLAAGDHAHVVGRLLVSRGGVTAAFDRSLVYELADGQIVDARAYEDDQYAFDAFFAAPVRAEVPPSAASAGSTAAAGPAGTAVVHPHVQLVQAYLAAAAAGDRSRAASFFHPDLVYVVAGRSPLAGVHRGAQAPFEYVAAIMAKSGGTYGIAQVRDWLVSDERVLLIADEHMTVGATTHTWTRYVLFSVDRAQFTDIRLFDDDQAAFDALWDVTSP